MMNTIGYKGYFIHTRHDEQVDEIRVQRPDYETLGTYKSVTAAKAAITRHIDYALALKQGPVIMARLRS